MQHIACVRVTFAVGMQYETNKLHAGTRIGAYTTWHCARLECVRAAEQEVSQGPRDLLWVVTVMGRGLFIPVGATCMGN